MANAIIRQVNEAYLPALRPLAGNIEQTNLCTVQRVSIIDGAPLPTAHHGFRHVQDA